MRKDTLDTIVSTFPSEYILDPNTLLESYRVLKPGGRLIIIPFVWITGRKPIYKAAAWLFKITAQSPTSGSVTLQPLFDIGFKAEVEKVNLVSSTVMIIHAKKREYKPV